MVCSEEAHLHASRLRALNRYMASRFDGRAIDDNLRLYRSRELYVFECLNRRELVKGVDWGSAVIGGEGAIWNSW